MKIYWTTMKIVIIFYHIKFNSVCTSENLCSPRMSLWGSLWGSARIGLCLREHQLKLCTCTVIYKLAEFAASVSESLIIISDSYLSYW